VLENEEKEIIKTLGVKIRKRRLELNLSQELLSFDSNIPRNQIGRIERGEINTSIITLYRLCKVLKIDMRDLF
jgi:transcriptional regulator with XRE-family HTH domain